MSEENKLEWGFGTMNLYIHKKKMKEQREEFLSDLSSIDCGFNPVRQIIELREKWEKRNLLDLKH